MTKKLAREKSGKLSKDAQETIAFFLAMNPQLDDCDIARLVEFNHEESPTPAEIRQIKSSHQSLIEEYRYGNLSAIQKGLKVGQLPYVSLYDRLKALSEIVDKGKNGYQDERISPKGDLIVVNSYNFAAATDAIKFITTLIETVQSEGEDTETVVEVYQEFSNEKEV